MALTFYGTSYGYYQDNGAPASSYSSFGVTIVNGQGYYDMTNNLFYICSNGSNQAALVWTSLGAGIPLAYQYAPDWNQSNSNAIDYIKNKPVRTQSSASRTLNSGFQLSATRDALVNYSVDIGCTISLTSGQTGTVFLEIASDSGFTTNLQELGRMVNGNTGTLTSGSNLIQNFTSTLSGYVPSGYYCRVRTENTSGTPTFNYCIGQEILL